MNFKWCSWILINVAESELMTIPFNYFSMILIDFGQLLWGGLQSGSTNLRRVCARTCRGRHFVSARLTRIWSFVTDRRNSNEIPSTHLPFRVPAEQNNKSRPLSNYQLSALRLIESRYIHIHIYIYMYVRIYTCRGFPSPTGRPPPKASPYS